MAGLIRTELCNDKRVVRFTCNSYPVIAEESLIRLAKVPVKGNALHESVLVDPRYVEGLRIKHELIEVRGYRRGRSIDIFLDENNPFVYEGKEYGILNFKGAGAQAADCEMVIHPTKWFVPGSNEWILRDPGDKFGRVWGALGWHEAHAEFKDLILPSLGIPQVPHIAVNDFPAELNHSIGTVSKVRNRRKFSQLVRACNTNIRMDDTLELDKVNSWLNQEFINRLAAIDAAVLRAQIELAKEGLMLSMIGKVAKNRFIDGLFTDAENYRFGSFDFESVRFVHEVLTSSRNLIQRAGAQVWPSQTLSEYYPAYQTFLEKARELLGPILFDHNGFNKGLTSTLTYVLRQAFGESLSSKNSGANSQTSPKLL